MKVYVGLISSSNVLIKEFTQTKEALIPKEIREKFAFKPNFKFDAFDPSNSKGRYTVDQHILNESRGYDYACCFIDDALLGLCGDLRHAVLNAVINPAGATGSLRNFFGSHLTKLFKAAIFTMEKMQTSDVEQAMRLPIRNFHAAELQELCRLYKEEILQNAFRDAAKTQIIAIGRRRQPRRSSTYNMKYFVDDKKKHFVFGKELHAVLPTGDPHKPHCELNGIFRFGRKISTNQHFNVSQGDGNETYIEGDFPNCHDAVVKPEKDQTHLNMFSNDHC